jgi:acyl carrier protein
LRAITALKEDIVVNVEEKVKAVLLEILDINEEAIVPTARFIDDLHATSIDLVEIITALQNTFDVNITESEAAKIKTVQDAVDLLKAAISQKGATS